MSDSVGLDLGVMHQASRHVYDTNVHIQTQLTQLITKLEGLQGSWRGDAATSFHVLKDRWNTDAQKLNEALRNIADALDKSHTNYSGTEDVNQTGFSRIGTALNG
jgi:WXG100 family type VII secretion target